MIFIILEGLDNTGKSEITKNLTEHYESLGMTCHYFHMGKPEGSNFQEQAEQCNLNNLNMCRNILSAKKNRLYDVIILDRSWYGEYVYGQLYREHDQFDILTNIRSIESSLLHTFRHKNDCMLFILTDVDNIKFCVKYDDNMSISNADTTLMSKEQSLFNEIFELADVNKCKVLVNDGLKHRNINDIIKEITDVVDIIQK